MLHGWMGGFLGGILIGGVVVANLVGFPKVEGGEAVAGGVTAAGGGGAILAASTAEPAASISIGRLSGGALFSPLGFTFGYAATKPTCGK